MSVNQFNFDSSEPYGGIVANDYETELQIRNSSYGGDVHESLIQAMDYLEKDELEQIFGIKEFNRLLGEGYKILDDLEVEDWAITGSYNGGEIAVGQTVSCDGKKFIPGTRIPKDFHQAIKFGERVENHPDLDLDVTGYYVVRTEYSPSEVRREKKRLGEDMKLFGFSNVSVNIYELEPEDREEFWPL